VLELAQRIQVHGQAGPSANGDGRGIDLGNGRGANQFLGVTGDIHQAMGTIDDVVTKQGRSVLLVELLVFV
jgi:hypothetical protein